MRYSRRLASAAWGRLAGVFILGFFTLALGVAAAPPAPGPTAQTRIRAAYTEYHDEIERDFPLRTSGSLQVTNMRGDIVIQGWSLDKIRVQARRRARASSAEEAQRLFSAVDFRFTASGGQLELGAEYGNGLTLQERLRERESPRTGMEMTVFAPAGMKLRVWGVDGKITIKGWDATVDVRAASGEINIDGVKSGGVSVLCPSCDIRMHSIRGHLRCMGGSGLIRIEDVRAAQTYVETATGALTAVEVCGEQLYVTKEGPLRGSRLSGRIEFHAGAAPVDIGDSEGFLSGRSTSGNVTARMREWDFADKAVIESVQGNICLSLPADFSGDVDLFSGQGPPEIGFPVTRTEDPTVPLQPGRVLGRVGEGGELLKVFSSQGSVQLKRDE